MKTIIWKTGIPTLLMIFILTSCEDSMFNCLRGNGERITEVRIISDNFTGIEMDGSFEIYFTQDTLYDVVVEADENIMRYVNTFVRGKNLIVDDNNRCFRTTEPIKIFITAPELESVLLDGSGYIQCDQLITDEIEIELRGSGEIDFINVFATYMETILSGSGKIELRGIDVEYIDASLPGSGKIELAGQAIETNLEVSGSGQIRAFPLEQDICHANIPGSGSIYVFVYEYLEVFISGSGAVFYKGYPDIDPHITGSGRLVDNNIINSIQ